MIMDELLEFADATALGTSGTGRQLVGDVIDLGATPGLVGANAPMYLVGQVTTAITSGGSATVSFELVTDAQAAIAVDASATVHAATAAFPKATLVAGYQFAIALPFLGSTYERYLGVIANVGTAALTAGAVNLFITNEVPAWTAYPNAT